MGAHGKRSDQEQVVAQSLQEGVGHGYGEGEFGRGGLESV